MIPGQGPPVRAFSKMDNRDAETQPGREQLAAPTSIRSSPARAEERDLDSAVIAATLNIMNTVLQERAEQLRTGVSLRDANAALLREYSEYVARLTGQDVATVRPAIARWLARSGATASATLLQLVVGTRVYDALRITPATGIFATGRHDMGGLDV